MVDGQKQPEVLYSWDAEEYTQAERNISWYWWALAVALVIVIYAVIIQQWTLIAVVLVAGVVIYLVGKTEPRTFTHELLDTGIRVGGRLYPYTTLQSFWFVIEGRVRELKVLQSGKLKPLLSLQLGNADVEQIRRVLSRFLPEEEERGEDIVDKMGRFLKF